MNNICVMVGQRRHVFCRGFSGPSSGNWGGEWLCRWGALGHLCLPFGCGVNVRDTACVPGHCELNRFGGDLYSIQRSQCHGHHSSSIDAEFFLTSLKTEIPETRANGWTSSEARGLWVALLLELVVSCLLYCSKGTVVITTL